MHNSTAQLSEQYLKPYFPFLSRLQKSLPIQGEERFDRLYSQHSINLSLYQQQQYQSPLLYDEQSKPMSTDKSFTYFIIYCLPFFIFGLMVGSLGPIIPYLAK